MKKPAWVIGVVGLGLMACCAGVLLAFDGRQHLGKPGVKVVAEPIYDEHGALARTNRIFLPERVLEYRSTNLPVTRLELNWLPADTTYGRRHYLAPDGHAVDVSAVLMGTDRTSIHKPEYCLPGQGFSIDRTEATWIAIEQPHPYRLPVTKMTATKAFKTADGNSASVRAVYVFWFASENQVTGDHVKRMWWMARDLVLTGTLQRWAYVGCLSVCYPGQEEAAFERMKRFISAAVPEFQLAVAPPPATNSP